jgi:hypothetical protein
MVGVHSWAYLEIWSYHPGARVLKDEPFVCKSTDSKVSSVGVDSGISFLGVFDA